MPQALGHVADGDAATGVGCRGTAREHVPHAAFGLIEIRRLRRGVQSRIDQFPVQFVEIKRRFRHVAPAGPLCFDLRGRRQRHPQVPRARELEVEDVLSGSPPGHLRERFTAPAVHHRVELGERIEELIVPGLARRRDAEVPHRQRVDQRPIEHRVGERVFHRTGDSVGAFDECDRGRIDTQAQFGRPLDVALCIDGPRHVIVEVAALGHALQERAEPHRIRLDAVEMALHA